MIVIYMVTCMGVDPLPIVYVFALWFAMDVLGYVVQRFHGFASRLSRQRAALLS